MFANGKDTKDATIDKNLLLRYIDIANYFKTEERVVNTVFSFEVFNHLNRLFTQNEIYELTELNKKFRHNFKNFLRV